MTGIPQKHEHRERNLVIYDLVNSQGHSQADVARKYKMTRQRVNDIIKQVRKLYN